MFLRMWFSLAVLLLVQALGFGSTMQGIGFAAALSTSHPTLLDWAKALDPNGQIARIVELLNQTNEVLDDMVWEEANNITSHRTTVRTGLPTPTWRLMNAGVVPAKATTAQIDEGIGQLEAWSRVDFDLANLGGNPGAFRASQARAHMEAMNQEMASTLFYGSSLAAEEFVGLAARYNALTGAGNSDNVIGAGTASGSTENTSIWLVAWDTETVTGIFPKGSTAGLQHEDFGAGIQDDAGGTAGAVMKVYQERFTWKAGIALKDWRYVVRICNIDVEELEEASSSPDLLRYMAEAEMRLPNSLGKRAFYMNRTVARNLRRQVTTAVTNGGGLTFDNFAGKRIMVFGTTPIRITDALLNTEAAVS